VDALTQAVVFATDFGPRELAVRVAVQEAQRRGLTVVGR